VQDLQRLAEASAIRWCGQPLPDQEKKSMDTRDPYLVQNQLSPRRIEAAGAPEDRRWPGVFMVLLILLGLVWPLGGMAAALLAYLTGDRDQATVLFAVATGALLLHWIFGG
jgi:hypothetical protein